jgi:hypothetical protein
MRNMWDGSKSFMKAAATILVAVLCISTAAQADRRVALVVGNSQYQFVPRIPNAQNDGRAMAALLHAEGFDVEFYQNLGNDDLRRAVRNFVEKTRDADVAVVYFAGHGIEVDGANYLIPVDARLRTDLSVHDEALSLDRVLQVLEPARRLRLVILDACRDNPFLRTMTRTVATRAVSRGLAQVEPSRPNTLIAFAAKAGSLAEDGSGEHSPFTTALLKHIAEPGLDIRLALGRVRDEVLEKTRNGQEPFVYGSLGGSLVALSSKVSLPAGAAVVDGAGDEARRDFVIAQRLGTLDGWDAFLSRHREGYVSDLARRERDRLAARIDQQKANEQTESPPPPAPRFGGSFAAEEREQVAQIAARNQMSLPSYEIRPVESDVSPAFRRFVGVWASRIGYNNGAGRQMMMIGTSVTKDGLLRGFLVGGPPTAASVNRQAAYIAPFVATIRGSTFSFHTAASHSVEMSRDGRLHMKDSWQQGMYSIDLEPVWLAADPAAGVDVAAVRPEEILQGGTAGDLFNEAARARVSAIASRNKLPLPEYSFAQSGRRTPDHLKKFIGVWASSKGFNGGPVQTMMIVTDVSEAGQAEGHFLVGATPPGSPRSRPARNIVLQGAVVGQRLSFATLRATVEATLGAENAFQMKVAETSGMISQTELAPVWTLLAGLHSPTRAPPPAASTKRTIQKRASPAVAVAPEPASGDAGSMRGGGRGGGGGQGGGADMYDHPRFAECARIANQRGMMGPGSGRRMFIRGCLTSG